MADKGADLNAANIDGWTPVHAAAEFAHIDVLEVSRYLHLVKVIQYYPLPCINGCIQVLETKGADIYAANIAGETAKSIAVAHGHDDAFELISKWEAAGCNKRVIMPQQINVH